MGDKSNIAWTQATWNPTTGCSHVSSGCKHCYAETLSLRMGWSKKPWTAQNAAENVLLHPERLLVPLRWKKPRRIFVNSMSDLFHEHVPYVFILQVFMVMAQARQHTFQVLTKRPERMLKWFRWAQESEASSGEPLNDPWPLPNVWLGVSAEDQETWDERIRLLGQVPAAVHWVSAEPLLGPIDVGNAFDDPPDFEGTYQPVRWVVAGGESGAGFRPMDLDWARALRDQCLWSDVPFFFKQIGGRTPKAGGHLLDGKVWQQFPETVRTA